MDPFLYAISAEDTRAGATYYSPAHLISYEKHWSGVPYWQIPGGIPYGQMYTNSLFAPDPVYAQPVLAPSIPVQTAVLGSVQAPTTGIYTGVEGTCNG